MSALPISVSELLEHLPHRPPAVWISEVLSVSQSTEGASGECRVSIDPDAPYCTNGMIRSSSSIEWMAQSYAFIRAASYAAETKRTEPKNSAPKKAFLAAVSDFKITPQGEQLKAHAGSFIRIAVQTVRSFGPITLVSGKVFDESGQLLAEAQLKVFSSD